MADHPDAYRVWVSEIMLQQTRVEAVKSYYHRFLEALPDVKALAEAEEDQLLQTLGRAWLLQQGPQYAESGNADHGRLRRRVSADI